MTSLFPSPPFSLPKHDYEDELFQVIATKDAWHHFQCPVRWDDMIDHWLGFGSDPRGRSLAGGVFSGVWKVFRVREPQDLTGSGESGRSRCR